MNIRIEMANPAELNDATLNDICEVAAAGFGRVDDAVMRADTIAHVRTAEQLQIARAEDDGSLIAFGAYGRSLWRLCR